MSFGFKQHPILDIRLPVAQLIKKFSPFSSPKNNEIQKLNQDSFKYFRSEERYSSVYKMMEG